jgi:hypothetical protein
VLRLRATATASALLLTMLAVTSCSGSASDAAVVEPPAPSASSSLLPEEAALDECSTPNLTVVNPGQLTVGAQGADIEPLFLDGTPATGEGFEPALTYALAETLGFDSADVSWVLVNPDADPFGAGPRVDFVIGQVPYASESGQTVTSDPYLLPAAGQNPYALLFVAGNPLVTCVNGALAELDASGEMASLADTWLRGSSLAGASVGSAARVS